MARQTADLVRVVDGALVPAPGTWEFDIGHSEIGFEGRHIATRVRGRFLKFSGRLNVAERPGESVAELEIDATSVFSGFKDRDDHLRSADWFAVDEHPTITFRSRSGSHVGWNHWRVTGDLTVRGITRVVELDVEFGGADVDPWGNRKLGLEVVASLDREMFGLGWNAPLASGGWLVGDEVTVRVSVEAVLTS
jgi:polyisoprenoid-binding protein YceI